MERVERTVEADCPMHAGYDSRLPLADRHVHVESVIEHSDL